MNIAMEQTEEYVNGQLKAKYGDAFIRGNNGAAEHHEAHKLPLERIERLTPLCAAAVLYISTQKRKG